MIKKIITTTTLVAAAAAMANAADVLIDFRLAEGATGANQTEIAKAIAELDDSLWFSAVSLTEVTVGKNNSTTSTTRFRGSSASSPLADTIVPDFNYNGNSGWTGGGSGWTHGTITITLTAARDLTISACELYSGFFNGGSGAFQANPAKTTWTVTKSGDTTNSFSGEITMPASATSTTLAALSATAGFTGWTVSTGDTITLAIDGVKGTSNPGFVGLDKLNLTVSPIPEPSMFGLLAGLGALALVGARRRRK